MIERFDIVYLEDMYIPWRTVLPGMWGIDAINVPTMRVPGRFLVTSRGLRNRNV